MALTTTTKRKRAWQGYAAVFAAGVLIHPLWHIVTWVIPG